ncbi:MAG: preprotein translocase subunit SecG [Planctomycetaceae bacterium]|nr:preprotein translocase subunit SecG [Planctomycetaceae bacterium]MBT6488042.1 preprotein translocase subunit SecG [Planctomycetaceae bacterium]MBT6497818.1 preprotein translocase subunit SecG [Planctomycetaceae bacterium]
MSIILAILLTVVSVLLMFVILLQRGRGGGLAGALGGAGGQSAFGTKAGDVFTKITIGLALIWVVLAGGTGMQMYADSSGRFPGGDKAPSSVSKSADDADADGEGGGLIIPPSEGTTPGGDTASKDTTTEGTTPSGDDASTNTDDKSPDDSEEKKPTDDGSSE